MSIETDRHLKEKLEAWEVEIDIPTRFQAGVWERIAVRDAARRPSAWRQVLRAVFAEMAAVRWASAITCLAIGAGIGAAHLQASETNAKHWKTLEIRYAQSIDPFEHGSAR